MKQRAILFVLSLAYLVAGCASQAPTTTTKPQALPYLHALQLAREPLPANDGWGAANGDTVGGAKARGPKVFTVTNRQQLLDAFAQGGNDAKIVLIDGTINLSTDATGKELVEKDFADPAYAFEAYKNAYAPDQWNRQVLTQGKPPALSGPQEEARKRSAQKQKSVVEIAVPSNTSLIGMDRGARIIKGNLVLNKVDNVIIRNIAFEDAFDYFPAWNPGEGFSAQTDDKASLPGCQETFVDDNTGPHRCSGGRWQAAYDLITLKGASHVWIDHCTFSDGKRFDVLYPSVFAAPYDQAAQIIRHHGRLLGINNGSDFVTVSNNKFQNHDNAIEVGERNTTESQPTPLRVSLHHNYLLLVSQGQPKVYAGQVHYYDNYLIGSQKDPNYPFISAIVLGQNARLLAENNTYQLEESTSPADLLRVYAAGGALLERGSMLNRKAADITADYNAKNPQQAMPTDIAWEPPVPQNVVPADAAAPNVKAYSGSGKL